MIGSINPLWLLVTFALLGADCQPLSDEQVASDKTPLLQYDSLSESSTSAEQKPRKIFKYKHGSMKIRAPLFDDEFVCSPEMREFDLEQMSEVKREMKSSFVTLIENPDWEDFLSSNFLSFAVGIRDFRIKKRNDLKVQPASVEFVQELDQFLESILNTEYPNEVTFKKARRIVLKLLDVFDIIAKESPTCLYVDWAETTIDGKSLKDFVAPLIRYLRESGFKLYLSNLKLSLKRIAESAYSSRLYN